MAKSMKNVERAATKLLETRAALVDAALDAGAFTRRDICKLSGLKLHEVSNLFEKDRECFARFQVRRKGLADIASDNIAVILEDSEHPHHFQASKYILQTYKSDLDETLTPQDSDSMELLVPGGSQEAAPVVIKFSSKKKID